MDTVNAIELANPDIFPSDEVLDGVLGASFGAYKALLDLFAHNGMDSEWRYYRDGKAWLCKVQRKKRTIVWMSAWKGFMQATIYFPSKYIDDVYGLDLDARTIAKIKATKNTGTSKPCTFEIRDESSLDDFGKVMQFKLIAK
jgi:hypothetical protein